MSKRFSNNQHSSAKLFDNQGLLTTEQLSEALQIPVKTIRDWTFKRQIPFKKVGRAVRFLPSEIEHWINQRK